MSDRPQLRFEAVVEDEPGAKWQARFARAGPHYREWFLKEGDGRRPGFLSCQQALHTHMPELVPTWERLTDLAGGDDQVARLLSLYCPTPYLVACTQCLWTSGEPVLIRNYDYHPAYCDGVILLSRWHDTRVIVSTDSLWGALDGMNEHGLAATLAFGGRRAVGKGFGMPLILRYVLEFSRNVAEAVEVLRRVPSHMAYTIGLIDASGTHATVHVGPDRPAEVLDARVSTNHQGAVEWPEYAALTKTEQRASFLEAAAAEPGMTPEALVAKFLRPPLVSRHWQRAFGTLYTASYRPRSGQVEYRWPHGTWVQGFDQFLEAEAVVTYPGDPSVD